MTDSQKPINQNQNKLFKKAFSGYDEDYVLTIENGLAIWKPKYYLKTEISTTNATATTIQTISIPTDTGIMIISYVLSRKTSGAGAGVGNTGDVNAYKRTAKAKNVGGTVTMGSISSDFTSEDIAAFNATFVISGTNILIRVSVALNDNVDWVATTDIYTI